MLAHNRSKNAIINNDQAILTTKNICITPYALRQWSWQSCRRTERTLGRNDILLHGISSKIARPSCIPTSYAYDRFRNRRSSNGEYVCEQTANNAAVQNIAKWKHDLRHLLLPWHCLERRRTEGRGQKAQIMRTSSHTRHRQSCAAWEQIYNVRTLCELGCGQICREICKP